MNDRELKIWAYNLAKKAVAKNKARTLPERKSLTERLERMIYEEEFLLERDKQYERLKH